MGTKCGEQLSMPRRLSRRRRCGSCAPCLAAPTIGISIFIAPLFVAQTAAAKSTTAEAKPQTGWVMQQKTQTGGRQIVLVTAGGVKLINEDTHFTTIAAAPQWNVITCNDATKRYMETTLRDYKGRYLRRIDQLRFSDLNLAVQRGASKTVHGVKTVAFFKGPSPIVRPTDELLTLSVLALDQPPQPPEACELLCRMYGIRNLHMVPLDIEYQNLKNRKRVRLTTQTIVKRDDIAISSHPPAGYTKTTDESKLMLDSVGKSDMKDMIESLGK
jgi:hypothetical protein